MCLAIPGKIVEIAEGQNEVGIVEVTGVRRKVQLGLLAEECRSKVTGCSFTSALPCRRSASGMLPNRCASFPCSVKSIRPWKRFADTVPKRQEVNQRRPRIRGGDLNHKAGD